MSSCLRWKWSKMPRQHNLAGPCWRKWSAVHCTWCWSMAKASTGGTFAAAKFSSTPANRSRPWPVACLKELSTPWSQSRAARRGIVVRSRLLAFLSASAPGTALGLKKEAICLCHWPCSSLLKCVPGVANAELSVSEHLGKQTGKGAVAMNVLDTPHWRKFGWFWFGGIMTMGLCRMNSVTSLLGAGSLVYLDCKCWDR